MYSSSLYPLITKPTRITANSSTLIDNVFTSELCVPIKSGILISDLTDHLPVFCLIGCNNKLQDTKSACYEFIRQVNPNNISKFNDYLQNEDWSDILRNDDVDNLYNDFMTIFTTGYDQCCPLKKVKIKATSLKPWLTSGLINACKKKNYLYVQFLKFRTQSAEKKYKLNGYYQPEI